VPPDPEFERLTVLETFLETLFSIDHTYGEF
jgi:hypothetical protein